MRKPRRGSWKVRAWSSARLWGRGVHKAACSLINVVWRVRLEATGREHFNPGPLFEPVVDLILLPLSGVVGQQPDPRKVTCDIDVNHGAELWWDVPSRSLREFNRLIVVRHALDGRRTALPLSTRPSRCPSWTTAALRFDQPDPQSSTGADATGWAARRRGGEPVTAAATAEVWSARRAMGDAPFRGLLSGVSALLALAARVAGGSKTTGGPKLTSAWQREDGPGSPRGFGAEAHHGTVGVESDWGGSLVASQRWRAAGGGPCTHRARPIRSAAESRKSRRPTNRGVSLCRIAVSSDGHERRLRLWAR